ncbi:hypothetical protein ACQCT5_04620 [Sutcliffiella halmapala]
MDKLEIQQVILNYLRDNPKTQMEAVRESVEQVLRENGQIGQRSRQIGRSVHTETVSINHDMALLINEVIYDLMYQDRIITPGLNKDNLELPFLHVSNMEKLVDFLDSYDE